MLKINKLTLKNFMSFGNVEQEINIDTNTLTLILGENRDITNVSQSADNRNGCGKSVLCSALSYVLFDKPIGNVKKDNLINKINEKNMEVSVEFEKNDNTYRIVRGRKPNILKLYINGDDVESQQGEVHDTQEEITEIIGMSYDLFNMIIIMNGTDVPFAQRKVADQKSIIEELLRITQLSEKADLIKEKINDISKNVEMEEFKINTIKEINEKTINQLDKLEKMSAKWNKEHNQNITDLTKALSDLMEIDIEQELAIHEITEEISRINLEISNLDKEKKQYKNSLADIETKIKRKQSHIDKANIEKECYACGQSIDENHSDMIDTMNKELSDMELKKKDIQKSIDDIDEKLVPLHESVDDIPDIDNPFYKSKKEAWSHDESIKVIKAELEKEMDASNPYDEQISSIRNETMQEVDDSVIASLNEDKQHYEFLHKILTGKDSFVRKRIIEQSIKFLNQRLSYYVEEIGLPHKVKFESDMNISIDLMGKLYDYDNLSRGQKTKLNIGLAFAFRDVFENLHFPINTLMVDEVIDNGMDGAGVDNSINIMKTMTRELKKSVFVISHKEEVKPKANRTMNVIFENSFSSIGEESDKKI